MNRSELAILMALIVLIIPLSLLTTEGAAVCLIYISFTIVWLNKEIRKDWRLLGIVLLALGAHQIASILNVYYVTLQGADMDAVTFQNIAVNMAHSIQPNWYSEFGRLELATSTYTWFLSLFYRAFGDSLLLGQGLSVLAYMISSLLLVKLTQHLRLSKWSIGLIALFGLLPSIVIFTSITMREAYQQLFFVMILYFTISLRKSISFFKMIMLIFAGVGLGYLHNGLIIYSIFLVCVSFFWGLRFNLAIWKSKSFGGQVIGFALLASASVVILWIAFASDLGGVSRAIVAGETADYVGVYRDKTSGSFDRATYGMQLDTSSVTAFIPSAILVFIFYMFAPFPWQITSPIDIYAALEGVLRFLLLYQAIATWYRIRGERRSQWGYLLLCYLSMEFLWALGTANWGTAIRHHTVAYSAIVLVGGPGLLSNMIRPMAKIRRRLAGRRNGLRQRGLATGSARIVKQQRSFPS